MSDPGQGPPPGERRPLRPVWFANGLFAFFIVNVLVLIVVGFDVASLLAGVLYTAAVIALAAVIYLRLGWREFAVGLVAGFVILTAASGGACTLFADPGFGP